MSTATNSPRAAFPLHARPLSLVVIVLYWAAATAQQLMLHPSPGSIPWLLLRKTVEAALTLATVWLLLRQSGEGLASLGFRARTRDLLVDALVIPTALFVLANVVMNPILTAALHSGGTSAVPTLFRDRSQAALWVLIAIVGGGFAEELQRAFVVTRFGQAFGRGGVVAAVVVDSAVFGFRHRYQGPAGMITAAFTGAMFAVVFLRRRRVIDAMVAHAAYDLIGIAVAYALYGS